MTSTALITCINSCYPRITQWLESWVGPVALVLMRLWVAFAFWRAGVVKFTDPASTQMLFESLYHVPLLAPGIAAVLGTWIELIAPWLLGLGIAGRATALFLFFYNLIAVISYPDLWPHGFWSGLMNLGDFTDHKVWAMILLAVVAWGPGKWSVDGILGKLWRDNDAR
ncbi:MAG: DoxX family protein [Castellaniella sp.]|uniref:DoxX family protein n=1 Tax=Castellaniella sp. TaxID=1955812 RepID=UPI00121605C2|nr:DoxX family protein [Castellaniella sp.]TAN29620.1 MAG: DoxX family protein [Castellaniella sp.]